MNTITNKAKAVTDKIEAKLSQVDEDWGNKVDEHNKLVDKINEEVETFEKERDKHLAELHTDFGFASRKELIKVLRSISKAEKEFNTSSEEAK